MKKTLQKADLFLGEHLVAVGIVFLLLLLEWPWWTLTLGALAVFVIGLILPPL